ncbi:peptidoglycan DD-metalloendopeptidase family protein [Cellulophaga baltica]|uniref:peptidoglycan DD-metalloendopeptidase family protein n=1 Tax=Cellulophaga baltica TaxID=76594 RepID=UPI0015F5B702|nr:peptidoglycan DD-metalloendopeptidase family protein [Cellulophaga baltica]MBA6315069.1 peptidoglycan DD-metalloendopeptidase family protein [Cellulophaga baltica]
MNELENVLIEYSKTSIPILDESIPLAKYCALDLSSANEALESIAITDPNECQQYINTILSANNAKVAHGGYLEKRNLYADKSSFSKELHTARNIHLGIDYWCVAGTKVLVPIDGVVHSFKNNDTVGDYGPTIILKHIINKVTFYTLYGHLSLETIRHLEVGAPFKAGACIGYLGTPVINVNYAPHLHFQIINSIGAYFGDYPGVCNGNDLEFYSNNCPDPNLLLKIGS